MQPPPPGDANYTQFTVDQAGVQVLHLSWVQSSDEQRINLPVGAVKTRPITGVADLVGMCQDFQSYQPSKRTVEHCICVDYAAVKKSTWTFWKVAAVVGIVVVAVGVVVLTAGGGIAVIGPSAAGATGAFSGTAAGVAGTTVAGYGAATIGVGSALATAAGTGMVLTEVQGVSVKDYETGAQLSDPYTQDRFGPYAPDGAVFEQRVGPPHKC